jgi:hypothetical protein
MRLHTPLASVSTQDSFPSHPDTLAAPRRLPKGPALSCLQRLSCVVVMWLPHWRAFRVHVSWSEMSGTPSGVLQ